MQSQDAQIDGAQVLLATRMDYESAAKAGSSKKAFIQGTEAIVKRMLESITKKLEAQMLYGGVGLAKFSATSGSGTTRVYTVTASEWASGLWAGMENCSTDVVNAGSKVNTNADVVVVSVDLDNHLISVSGNAADLTAIDTVIASSPTVYFKGAFGNEMQGLHAIMSNTGTIFNINAASYNLWKSPSYAVAGALTLPKILSAVSKAVARGLLEDATIIVSPGAFANLSADQSSLRRYESPGDIKDARNGASQLVYNAQCGSITVQSHIMCKEGYAYIAPMKQLRRVGATDVTFQAPGSSEGEIFIHLQSQAGFELRCYSHQALLLLTPAKACLLTGIVNT